MAATLSRADYRRREERPLHPLKRSLPEDSPPQRLFFETYYRIHAAADVPGLPALLPEVWLHWDYKTVRERGVVALLAQRMDFLLLTADHGRIVLEVDGRSHYTNPARYARQTASDRDLALRGYAVYRFGAYELRTDEQATELLTAFFATLFTRHGVRPIH